MMFDPFGDYASAGYLRNVFGFKDKDRVAAAERFEVSSNAVEAATFLGSAASLTYAHVLQTHKILFGGFYPWAGRDRCSTAPNISISKAGIEDMFAKTCSRFLAMKRWPWISR